jgi:hypothetical protein
MPRFSEPELYLLEEWTNARLLEDAMKAIREKYAAIFEKVLDKVQEKHEELDSRETRLTNDGVNVGIGKKSWRSKPTYFISGFWIGEVRIQDLTSEDEDAPDKTIWINHPEGAVDIEEARKKLRESAMSILSKEELRRADFDSGKGIAGVTYPIIQSRAELLELLIKDEARGFISCMVAHFESMTGFTAIVDEIYDAGNGGRD